MQIVLASASPYRKAQLEAFGVKFRSERPRVDEEALKLVGPADPIELTRFLAKAKADSLISSYPEALILGSDQMAELDGERLDKPGSIAAAEAQLARLSGRAHRLITSLAVVTNAQTILETEITTVRFRDLSAVEICAYVALDRPTDCAGAYKIERAGLALVEEIRGGDPGAIQGLPLIALRRALAQLNIPLTDLWRLNHAHP